MAGWDCVGAAGGGAVSASVEERQESCAWLQVGMGDKATMTCRSNDTFVSLQVAILYAYNSYIKICTVINVILGYVHRNQQFTLL